MQTRPARRLLLLLPAAAVLSSAALASPATRQALVIGNGNYRGVPPLANPPRDARQVARVLARLGFAVDLLLDADHAAMRAGLERLGRAATGAEAAVLFYAGHAAEVAGRNLLFPTDVSARSDATLLTSAMPFDAVTSTLEGRARATLIFLDACRDNPLGAAAPAAPQRRAGTDGRPTRSAAGGLAPVRSSAGMLIAFATAPGDVALDGTGEHSPFTAALLRHIETPNLEVRTMLTRVRRSVQQATDGQQVPWDNSSLMANFFFAAAPGRDGVAPGPTQRTIEEAASLGIPLPQGIEGLRFRREAGPGAGLVGVWSSGTRRFGGDGRHAMLVVLQVDHAAGTAAILFAYGPPTPHSADQLPAGSWRSIAQLTDQTLRWSNRAGARFVLFPLDQNEARLTVQRGTGQPVPVTLRRLE